MEHKLAGHRLGQGAGAGGKREKIPIICQGISGFHPSPKKIGLLFLCLNPTPSAVCNPNYREED
jgi:hypothetical protein